MKIELFNESCFDVMPRLPVHSVDALITDPPYATTDLPWDKRVDWPAFWAEAHRVCRPGAVMVLFSAQPFTTELINSNRKCFRYELIWAKNRTTGFLNANRRPLTAHENVLIFSQQFRGTTYNPQKTAGSPYSRTQRQACAHYNKYQVITSTNATGQRHPKSWLNIAHDSKLGFHPTQKPLELMLWLVRTYSNQGDVVLDPFMGSGSTGVAAQTTGRRFIGIEKEAEYFHTARKRLNIE